VPESVVTKVAWAIRRSLGEKDRGKGGAPAPDGQAEGDRPLDGAELEVAAAAINACFDEIWSDGYLVGAKCGSSGMNQELLRTVAKGYLFDRPRGFGSAHPSGAMLPTESAAAPETDPGPPVKPQAR
jgi:hypothetical protein